MSLVNNTTSTAAMRCLLSFRPSFAVLLAVLLDGMDCESTSVTVLLCYRSGFASLRRYSIANGADCGNKPYVRSV